MPKRINSRDLSCLGRLDIENEMREIMDHVLIEPRIPTMGNKLIVEASTIGHYPGHLWEHFGVKNMPPWSIEEQISVIIDCAKAGAAAIHTHPRDPGDKYNYETSAGKGMSSKLTKKVMDKAYEKVDFIPLNHAWHPKDWVDLADADFITHTTELLELGKGNKYIQGNVIPLWIFPKVRRGLLSAWFTASSIKEGIRFLEDNNVKPLIALHMDHITWFKTNLIDTGIFKTRPHLNIQEGKHGVDRSFADPWSYLNIISNIEMVRKLIPDCTLGLHAGGRNWLPMTVMGIMMGVDLVRIGIEDQFWAYPHKDEILKKPSDSVRAVVQIATALGRDIASPAEARKILGINSTSKK